MNRTSRIATAAAAAALLLTALPVGAESTIAIDDLEASAADGIITIEGDVDFDHAPIELSDATGDSLAPTTDLASASIQMITDRRVEVSVSLADALPEVGSSTMSMFRWETDQFIATAMHNRYSAAGEWSFDLQSCGEGPAGNQCSGQDTFGTYEDGTITWELNGLLGFGDSFAPAEDGLHATQTGGGLIWLNGFPYDALGHGLIKLPTLEITATNTTTGISIDATPSRSDIDLWLPGSAGDVIEVEACLDDVCTTSTVTA